MLIPRLKREQKSAAAVTTEAHIVWEVNTEPVRYMTTARPRETSRAAQHLHEDAPAANQRPGKPRGLTPTPLRVRIPHLRLRLVCTRLSEASFRMFGGTLALLCVAVCCFADAEDTSVLYRRPSCAGMSVTEACPLNYSPVCGSDGITYPNECFLCVYRLEKNADILIVREGPCRG